jgi:pimeloyl-ACP methyl ester carboxylesterase
MSTLNNVIRRRLFRRGLLAMVAVTLLVLTGCVSPPTRWAAPISGRGGVSPSPGAKPQWTPCPEIAQQLLGKRPSNVAFDCATIAVPQDWSAPQDGKTFKIALIRARVAGQGQTLGSLVVNPGGPGVSGIDLAVDLSQRLPVEILRRFDLVGFDPRGVGRSTEVKCFSDATLDANFGADPDPVSQTDFDAAVALARTMAQNCGDKYGDSLRLFSTEQAARDIDAIRTAVGDPKLTYLGYSYGTLLGAVYAQLFPTKVRALVLDGAVDPTQKSVTASETQARGFEHAFDNFGAWCKANASKCPIAADPRGAVVAALDAARGSPVIGAGGRKATAGWVFVGVLYALYSQQLWPYLGAGVAKLRSGDPAVMFQLADSYAERDVSGHYNNLFDALLTVNCTDDDASPTVERARALQSEWRAKYPLFGTSAALNLVCAQWPGKRDPYPAGKATGAPPIVVVGTKGDPATPYEQTAALADMLGVGVVLTWEGEGHTAYPQTRCINEAVNAYLIDLRPPAVGTTCPAR